MNIYPRGTTHTERNIMNVLAVAAFIVLLLTIVSLLTNQVTVELLTWIVALLFLTLFSMEFVVFRILMRNRGMA